MAGKGGGAWKVAYADFVTAMMAFFLVMWIVGQGDKVKQAVAESFNQPFGWSEARGTHPPPKVNGLQRMAIATGQHAQSDPDHVRARRRRYEDISTSILFAEHSSELDAKARQTLEQLVPQLAGKLQLIEIRGHDTPRPANKDGQVWDICYARCLATVQFLEEHGIAGDRIRISLAGGNEPTGDPAQRMPRNNARVEILLLSEFARPQGDPPRE